jgi:hypothetical protein
MKHQLLKQTIGTSSVSCISEFETDHTVKDLCHAGEYGFLFIHGDYVGRIVNGEAEPTFAGPFKNPCSISYAPLLRRVFVLGNGGKNVNSFRIELGYVEPFFGLAYKDQWAKLFANVGPDNKVSITVDDLGHIFVISEFHNKIYKLLSSRFEEFAGTGNPEFATSTHLSTTSFCAPTSIIYFNSALYVSDTGSGSIRKINDGRCQVIASKALGHDIKRPTKLRVQDNMVYFIDEGKVKYFSISDKQCGILFSKAFLSMDIDRKRNLYVLTGG